MVATKPLSEPKTLQEAISYFADPDRAFEYAKKLRWPDGNVICPRCGAAKNSFIKTRKLWFCYACKKQFTIKVKTIFEDSPLGLDKWMTAFWMLANCKNGVSSHELGRTLGITQTSAWFMLQRIREVLGNKKAGSRKIGGEGNEVEIDETFVGGKLKNMHREKQARYRALTSTGYGAGVTGKSVVMGMLDRSARQIRATVVPDVSRLTLQNAVLSNVEHGTNVYTDQASAYQRLSRTYIHEIVNHAETYVRGRVHTNGLENFWSLFKRNLSGTYVCVEPFHLERYVDEQVFRYNNRGSKESPMKDADRFALAMSQVYGHRLTYSELTGKNESPRHEETGAGTASEPF
jgi:transposase-like protein